jgi:Tol biopolymer transport system component/predicted Ser/Thr protein kinase
MPTLKAGEHLGHFEILAHIGAGGMGEVYQASDRQLNRDVALKVLPSLFSKDPERMARFEREARFLASLNHPHIASIYGVEAQALVMELVDGPSLQERIQAGPIPLDEALAIASQIAEALQYAHDKGIVHRDLKPANVKFTADGAVKLLDFGLAKAMEESPVASDPSNSPTLSIAATQAGMILGTASYMAPEQARGKRVDHRADIWAFGAVLYEMLTGKRLFGGEDLTETLASVVKDQPDLGKLPARVRPLAAACLEKDPRKRLHAICDWKLLVPDREPQAPDVTHARRWMSLLPWAAVGVLAMAAGWLYLRTPVPEPKHLMRFEVASAPGNINWPQISPDGQTILFVTSSQGLWKRSIAAVDAELIPGTQGATDPFWSADSKNIAFFQQGALKRVSIMGAPIVTLCPAVDGRGGSWNETGVILFAPGPSTGLFRVPAGGGTPEVVIRLGETGATETIRFPSFLPDGEHFIYGHVTGSAQTGGLYLGSLKGGAPVRLHADYTRGVYAAGMLLFRVQETLMAQPFDLESLRLSGEMTPVAEGVGEGGHTGYGAFSVSENGTLVYRGSVAQASQQFTWFDRSGRSAETIGDPSQMFGVARLSPDGKQVAFGRPLGAGRAAVFLQPVSGGPASQIARGTRAGSRQVWSPDGTRIAFSKTTSGGEDLFVKHLNGGAQEEPLNAGGLNATPTDWSREWIAFEKTSGQTSKDIWLLPTTGGGKPVVFLQTPANEGDGRISPDGRWMTYTQENAGRYEVFVQAISPEGAATGIPHHVSSSGGLFPYWRRDGKELFYSSADGLVAIPVTLGTTFQRGTALTLFKLPQGAEGRVDSADGQRFLVTVPVGADNPANSLTVVLNWTEALKK